MADLDDMDNMFNKVSNEHRALHVLDGQVFAKDTSVKIQLKDEPPRVILLTARNTKTLRSIQFSDIKNLDYSALRLQGRVVLTYIYNSNLEGELTLEDRDIRFDSNQKLALNDIEHNREVLKKFCLFIADYRQGRIAKAEAKPFDPRPAGIPASKALGRPSAGQRKSFMSSPVKSPTASPSQPRYAPVVNSPRKPDMFAADLDDDLYSSSSTGLPPNKRAQRPIEGGYKPTVEVPASPQKQLSLNLSIALPAKKELPVLSKYPPVVDVVPQPRQLLSESVKSSAPSMSRGERMVQSVHNSNTWTASPPRRPPPVPTAQLVSSMHGNRNAPAPSRSLFGRTDIATSTPLTRLTRSTETRSSEGLVNSGVSCYRNAVLQALHRLQPLAFELKAQWPHFKDLKHQMPLYSALFEFFSQGRRMEDVKSIEKAVSDTSARFRSSRQEDAHEFLVYCLTGLDEEIRSAVKNSESLEGEDLEKRLREVSPVVRVFENCLEQTLICNQCGLSSRTTESVTCFSLIIDKEYSGRLNLLGLINVYLQDEHVEYTCSKCSCKTCTKTLRIIKLAPVVLFHLKRFEITLSQRSKKLLNEVQYNLKLDLTNFCTPTTETPTGVEAKTPETKHANDSGLGASTGSPRIRENFVQSDSSARNNVRKRLFSFTGDEDENEDLTPIGSDVKRRKSEEELVQFAIQESLDTSKNQPEDVQLARAIAASLQQGPEESDYDRQLQAAIELSRLENENLDDEGIEVIPEPAVPESKVLGHLKHINGRYNLASVICHLGTESFAGHYITKGLDAGIWKQYNDECVAQIDNGQLLGNRAQRDAYLLCYVHENCSK